MKNWIKKGIRLVLCSVVISLVLTVSGIGVFAADDYPSKWKNAPKDAYVDSWGFYSRECTSFVAFRLQSRNGFTLPRAFGYAIDWKNNAQRRGYAVDSNPKPGSVAWFSYKPYGHVAWVESVNGNKVILEEYNGDWSGSGNYSSKTINKSSANCYIHFKDLSSSATDSAASSTAGSSANSSGSQWNGVGNAAYKGDHLSSGQILNANEYLLSPDGCFVLIMQNDGNLVLYHNSKAYWASNTAGNNGAYLSLQNDGNIVIYKSDRKTPIWATSTNSAKVFNMQNDGNVVAYNGSRAVWASNTVLAQDDLKYFGSDQLTTNQRLSSGCYIRSGDKRYTALMQSDGNFVVYAPGYRVVWAAGTNGNDGAYVIVQGDGNVVIYTNSGKAKWATGLKNIQRLVMQSDGNLVCYTGNGQAKWASDTVGKK